MILQLPKKKAFLIAIHTTEKGPRGENSTPTSRIYSPQLPICKAIFGGCPSRGVGWEGNCPKDPLEHRILTPTLVPFFNHPSRIGSMALPYMDPIGIYV